MDMDWNCIIYVRKEREMVFINKTKEYDKLVLLQKRISFFSKAMPFLGIALAIVVCIIGNFKLWSLILGAVLLLAGIIGKIIFAKMFLANSKKIVKIFISEYNVDNPIKVKFIRDNCNVENRIFTKDLFAFMRGNSINFVSASFASISSEKKFSAAYKYCIDSDFGVLSIDIDRIDSYRNDTQTTILTLVGESVNKIEFDSDRAFETFIPKKEYYYSTSKKST